MEERRLMQIVGQCVRHEKEFREGIMEFSEKMERLREREGRSDFGRVCVRRKRVEDVGKRVVAESGNGGLTLTFKRYKKSFIVHYGLRMREQNRRPHRSHHLQSRRKY